MSKKIIDVLGYARANEQFVVKTENFNVRINKNPNYPELDAPSPIEYILAGYAGCINAVGTLIAKELDLKLKSLQVNVSGEIDVDRYFGKTTAERAGFKSIKVAIKPVIEASSEELYNWLAILESRCPVYDNLINETPIQINLIHSLTAFETA